jgi:putative spermidine/putrescine transport system substrate-binding protein
MFRHTFLGGERQVHDNAKPSATRRQFLAGAASVAAPMILSSGCTKSGPQLVVVDFGGAGGEAKRRAIYEPFTQKTGINIVPVSGPDLAKIRSQVQAKDVEWDVVDLLDAWLPACRRFGLLEPIDERIVNREGVDPRAFNPLAIGSTIYSAGIAFPTDRLQNKNPTNWQEFWDVGRFPGRRGLRNRINDTLEIALMADGVAAKDVYPCDIERAFKALDRIKPSVTNWIAQSEQTVSLIMSDETDFTYTYVSRVKNMQAAEVPIGYSFKQNIIGVGWTGVVRGTRRRDEAMRLCAYAARPEVQLRLANMTGDAPCYPAVMNKIDPAMTKWMPRIDDPDNLFVNSLWWDSHIDELTLRFKNWLLT